MRRLPVLVGAGLLLLTTATVPSAAQAERPDPPAAPGARLPAAQTILLAGPRDEHTSVPAPRAATTTDRRAVTFNINYSGFTRPARRAFQAAADIWASRLSSPVPIKVRASFEPLGPGVLGSAGPSSVWRDFRGAPRAGTFYVDAVANRLAGRQLGSSPDIVARFSSTRPDWYFGRDGQTPAGEYDFESVVLHELGHGLGFLGAGSVSGGRGSVRLSGFPISYDAFTENQGGTRLLSFPDDSTQLANQLTSNSVWFDSAPVRNAAGGNRARLYAPSSWQQGSSYSHLNEATYGAGNPHSLMTPAIGSAESIHNPGGITLAILDSVGW